MIQTFAYQTSGALSSNKSLLLPRAKLIIHTLYNMWFSNSGVNSVILFNRFGKDGLCYDFFEGICLIKSNASLILSFQIEHMDALFEAQFSPLADSGRALSKCGKCLRYMKHITAVPPRLFCGTCEEVYYLPQKGTVKVKTLSSPKPLSWNLSEALLGFIVIKHESESFVNWSLTAIQGTHMSFRQLWARDLFSSRSRGEILSTVPILLQLSPIRRHRHTLWSL